MTVRYVGPGGNNGNNGLSWDNRKLTLDGVEDTPVVAGDIVYVGPGVYREQLTVDVSGTSDVARITYIGDVTGENTDGIGGIIRITGSNNDTTSTRNYCIYGQTNNYRTFRGFTLDFAGYQEIGLQDAPTNWIIEYCDIRIGGSNSLIYIGGSSNIIIRNCILYGSTSNSGITIAYAVASNILIENCLLGGCRNEVVLSSSTGVMIKNCTFIGNGMFLSADGGIYISTATGGGYQVSVYNCIFAGGYSCFYATGVNDIDENYNCICGESVPRTNTNTGANSNIYSPIFESPILVNTFKFPYRFFELSIDSPVRAITGTSTATNDFYGLARPTTESKKSWGMIQASSISTTDAIVITFEDAGRKQILIPKSLITSGISVKCKRDSNYTGTYPQMIIKQPGQSDRTTTDTGSSGTWNTLTDSFTPALSPWYVMVELVSNNTDTSNPTTNNAYFKDLTVG